MHYRWPARTVTDYFSRIDTQLVLDSSKIVFDITCAEITKRFRAEYTIRPTFDRIFDQLPNCPDSPKLRHWVSVSRSLLRSRLQASDPEPRFVAHFHVDSLEESRVTDLHSLRALEITLEEAIRSGRPFLWEDPKLLSPPAFSVWGHGTFHADQPSPGFRVALTDSQLKIGFGSSAAELDISRSRTSGSADVAFRSTILVNTVAGQFVCPVDVMGLADCSHSNAPVVRTMNALRPWTGTLSSAVALLHSQDAELASDCHKLAPAVLALHTGGTSYGSSSPEELAGLVFLPGILDTHDVAECLLHESLHQKLFRLEQSASLFTGETGDLEAYYSPWRSDPRPLRMLMHGAYVFAGVSNMWTRLAMKTPNDSDRENASFHAYYRAQQCSAALDIVEKYDTLTPVGTKVARIVRTGIDDALSDLCVSTAVRDETRERLAAHRNRFGHHRH
jgi:hypothetical protein